MYGTSLFGKELSIPSKNFRFAWVPMYLGICTYPSRIATLEQKKKMKAGEKGRREKNSIKRIIEKRGKGVLAFTLLLSMGGG